MKIESPCNDKCFNEDNHCTGCHRHIDDIINWANMNDKEKREVYKKIEERKKLLNLK